MTFVEAKVRWEEQDIGNSEDRPEENIPADFGTFGAARKDTISMVDY